MYDESRSWRVKLVVDTIKPKTPTYFHSSRKILILIKTLKKKNKNNPSDYINIEFKKCIYGHLKKKCPGQTPNTIRAKMHYWPARESVTQQQIVLFTALTISSYPTLSWSSNASVKHLKYPKCATDLGKQQKNVSNCWLAEK